MLCEIAMRRIHGQDGMLYALRVTGKTAVGSSGTGGRDTKDLLTREEVNATLRSLGLHEEVLAAASGFMDSPEYGERFRPIAQDVQIPFDVLERAEIYLFD